MARQQEERIQTIERQANSERYATGVFYSGGPERPAQRSDGYGATYSNGQARPVTPIAPMNRPVAKVQPVTGNSNAANVRNENWRQDQVAFSIETNEHRNGSSLKAAPAARPGRAGRGNAAGPAYSDDFRRTLDALLNGRG